MAGRKARLPALLLCFCALASFPALVSGPARAQAAAADDAAALIVDLRANPFSRRHHAAFRIHKLGKAALPVLVENIGDCTPTLIVLANPISSYVDAAELQPQCAGILYAYMVQLILGRNRLEPNNGNEVSWPLGGDRRNYLYGVGLIFNREEKAPSPADMAEIKKIYSAWWARNKDKSLEEMRKDTLDPLDGSAYHWR